MKSFLISCLVGLLPLSVMAQEKADIEAEIASNKDTIKVFQKRVDSLQAKLNALPGWRFGAFGTIGGNISEFTNWYAQGFPNNSSGNIGFTLNAFANLKQPSFYWRNAINTNLSWVRIDDRDDPDDDTGFRAATDVFNLTSLFGLKLDEKWAISTLLEYRTTLIYNFHNPGYFDLGFGATWTPVTDLVVVIQPLNYNIVLSDEDELFESSGGAKIVADYTRKLGAVSFKTNLSVFQSYRDTNLSNWTWTNSLAYTLWKVIGLGFDFGLRNNRQETLNFVRNNAPTPDPDATFDRIDNELQSYWTLGLSYSF